MISRLRSFNFAEALTVGKGLLKFIFKELHALLVALKLVVHDVLQLLGFLFHLLAQFMLGTGYLLCCYFPYSFLHQCVV